MINSEADSLTRSAVRNTKFGGNYHLRTTREIRFEPGIAECRPTPSDSHVQPVYPPSYQEC